jgi:3-phosphoshikimate 1-carboxyvinyltransferase
MPLPDLIEIMPLDKPVRAEVTVPGSKSITNRALVLAALADGTVTLKGALWSEDTQVMVDCLKKLGFAVDVQPDPEEFCNRTITVQGQGGRIPNVGTAEQPLELFVGNAGTAARFLAAMVCLGNGVYRLSGVPRMHERPQAALFAALRELGYRVESPNDRLPAVIGQKSNARSHKSGRSCTVSISESSQFASALLLNARVGGWKVNVVGENAEESPYVMMTTELIKAFPHRGGEFQIEPDASSGSYLWAAGWILAPALVITRSESCTGVRRFGTDFMPTLSDQLERIPVIVHDWPVSSGQIDACFPRYLPLPETVSRHRDLGDSVMSAVILGPMAERTIHFVDLGRLRLQECERVVALRTELTKCGAQVIEEGDTLTVYPSQLHGATIETYNDHRMAMCFAILGLKVPGIKIQNPACVKKTFPNFFQKLATPPPRGLGAEIRDGHTGRRLGVEELFAE